MILNPMKRTRVLAILRGSSMTPFPVSIMPHAPVSVACRPCPACGGPLLKYRKDWLFRCGGCHLLGSSLAPELNRNQHALDETARYDALHALRKANFRLILDELER